MSEPVKVVAFSGALLERGFWLYVWAVATPDGNMIYYVGRTGDSSSPSKLSRR